MSAVLISAALLLSGLAGASQPPSALRVNNCACKEASASADIIFRGIAIDAELRASPDGQEVDARQATIFRVMTIIKGSAENPVKVWHITDTDGCGVRFDYGQIYIVQARKIESGIETDACLMPPAGTPPK